MENEIKDLTPLEAKPAPVKKVRPSRAKPKTDVAVVAAPIQVLPEQLTPTAPVLTPEQERRNALKAKWSRDRERNSKLVTGKFLFNECPGGQLDFVYREFPGDPLVKYKMKHDSIHTIPLGVARHLNNRCSYPEYQHNLDNGKAVHSPETRSDERINMYIMSKVHRTSFIPLDFTEDADYREKEIAQIGYQTPYSNTVMLDNLGR